MSHELTMKGKQAEMAYRGEVPWHGLGQALKKGASIEEWTKAAGMAWKVLRSKVRFAAGPAETPAQMSSNILEWPEKHVLFRNDDHYPLGIVSDNYKVVQPKEVLEFFRDLCKNNEFEMETAGTLFGGRQYWALAKIGEKANIVKGDELRGYLLLTTSADGTKATTAKFVATRVVCYNTLSMAMGEAGKRQVKVSHRTEFHANDVKLDLGIGHAIFKDFIGVCKELTEYRPSEGEVTRYLATLLNENHVDKGEGIGKSRAYVKILGLYQGDGLGSQLPGVKGTAWGLVNAVTEYIDHHRSSREADTRLNNLWFGIGDKIKSAAFVMAQTMKKGGKK